MCLSNIPPDWTGENWAKGFHNSTAPMGGGGQLVFLLIEFLFQLDSQVVYWFMLEINTEFIIPHFICQRKWHYVWNTISNFLIFKGLILINGKFTFISSLIHLRKFGHENEWGNMKLRVFELFVQRLSKSRKDN